MKDRFFQILMLVSILWSIGLFVTAVYYELTGGSAPIIAYTAFPTFAMMAIQYVIYGNYSPTYLFKREK